MGSLYHLTSCRVEPGSAARNPTRLVGPKVRSRTGVTREARAPTKSKSEDRDPRNRRLSAGVFAEVRALVTTPFLMARDSNTHSYSVDQVVTDQATSDCDRKLGPGSRPKPVLIAGSVAMHGVPPAVDKTCCDCQHDEKGKPAARSVEKSFRMAFPTGRYQTEQSEHGSNGHPSQGKSQSRAKPEGDQEAETKEESGGETGRPHIHGRGPTPALSSSGAGAIAQSKRKQNHAGKGEKNKKQ